MVGEFTGKFDREILKSHLVDPAQQQREREQREQQRLEQELHQIGKIIDHRRKFLLERFANALADEETPPPGVPGMALRFEPDGVLRKAKFVLRARPNDSRLAIVIEARYEIAGLQHPSYDYITLPVTQVDLERARRFIEAKLIDFARAYVG
ncbi:MAG: hypothetical protein KatS3mg102_1160 [Planctomycetota bacterium]|nr:MAG: hypothetical protein KatS3mg102_1160 [Planctomycetota bacterium]